MGSPATVTPEQFDEVLAVARRPTCTPPRSASGPRRRPTRRGPSRRSSSAGRFAMNAVAVDPTTMTAVSQVTWDDYPLHGEGREARHQHPHGRAVRAAEPARAARGGARHRRDGRPRVRDVVAATDARHARRPHARRRRARTRTVVGCDRRRRRRDRASRCCCPSSGSPCSGSCWSTRWSPRSGRVPGDPGDGREARGDPPRSSRPSSGAGQAATAP